MHRRFSGFLVALAVIGMISWGCSGKAPTEEQTRTAGDVVSDAAVTASVKIALAFERGVSALDITSIPTGAR